MPASSVALLIVGALLGSFIGWIGSLVRRCDSNRAIYLSIGGGAAGGLLGPLAVGMNSNLDSLLASALAAMAVVAALAALIKVAPRRWRGGRWVVRLRKAGWFGTAPLHQMMFLV